MLTYEQIKAIENALGVEAARPVVEAIQSTDQRVLASLMAEIATKADIEKLRGEFREAISGVRTESAGLRGEFREAISGMHTESAELRGELREAISGIHTESAALRGEFREAISGVRTESAGLRGEMREEVTSLRGDIKRLDLQMKLLIGLAVLAIAMFSPNLAALVRLAK